MRYDGGARLSQPDGKVSHAHERKLVARSRSGDRRATRELIDLHKDRLFSFVYRMVQHHHDAEEICQDALLKAFASLDSFSTEFRFSTWLFTIGYRVCLNRMRRRHEYSGEVDLLPLAGGRTESVSETLESEDVNRLRDRIWCAVDDLTPAQRAAVLLFYRHEMGCHEIAGVMELPVATVKSHLHRARGRLRQLLADMEYEGNGLDRNRIADVG